MLLNSHIVREEFFVKEIPQIWQEICQFIKFVNFDCHLSKIKFGKKNIPSKEVENGYRLTKKSTIIVIKKI